MKEFIIETEDGNYYLITYEKHMLNKVEINISHLSYPKVKYAVISILPVGMDGDYFINKRIKNELLNIKHLRPGAKVIYELRPNGNVQTTLPIKKVFIRK